MRDWPGLGERSCDPRTLLPLESAFTVVTFLSTGPHLSLGLDEDEDGRAGGMGVEPLMGEGRKHSPQGQMPSCPVLCCSSALPSSPAGRQDRLGWWRVAGPARPSSLLPGAAGSSPRRKLPRNPKERCLSLGNIYPEVLRSETPSSRASCRGSRCRQHPGCRAEGWWAQSSTVRQDLPRRGKCVCTVWSSGHTAIHGY